jgi:fucose 4-O-acetylase-like acetyltransferase
MFFYISGFAASFFKTEKHMAYAHFTWGKCTRIIFPFLVAVPLFLIPALWLQRGYANTAIDGVTNDDSMLTWFGAYLSSPAEIFNHISWLWYLPAMFVDFMLTYPILRWTKRRQMDISFSRGDIEVLVL